FEARPEMYIAATRLVAVDSDGSEQKVLLERRLEDRFTQFQDQIVDWLPDDPDNVLVVLPSTNPSQPGSTIAKLNINTSDLVPEEHARDYAFGWMSDGHGAPRLYLRIDTTTRRFMVRDKPAGDWSVLREQKVSDANNSFQPIGFGENRNELLYYDVHEGRKALFGLDLEHDRATRLIYSHPTYDVAGVQAIGKYRRLVAAFYADDRIHPHFFDSRIEKIVAALARQFPGKGVAVIDEDWDQRYYLVHVTSDTDAGSFYRFDTDVLRLERITDAYPSLTGHELAPMRAITYPAADGTQIPAYLTLPKSPAAGPLPAIVLPHGGPSARDYWTYDFLVQYLAASGYAVLQSNYRGSDGYGNAWRGEGGFRDWRRAIGDIAAGTQYLVKEGIADPKRICAVGWSYGGYAALMSVIEDPKTYRCVVSIAGVTDPAALAARAESFVGGAAAGEFIGANDPDVRVKGSPIQRAKEIAVPVLLVHARHDLNVPFSQSETFATALGRAHKDVAFVTYDFAEHNIAPERYRIDLLTRLGAFLEEQTSR
ncbi:MAG TPA: alpha/beta fold hydrolase, partial [Gammaproteobacteria bacterium]|nr:alpha/beta fold hydrolase [Gammaproteobacteria bacterium]